VPLLRDAKTLFHLATASGRGSSHAERLENFYSAQSKDYDSFRERLLKGRCDLIESLDLKPGAVWLDLGGGTGQNLEFAGERLAALKKVYVVDLSPSLLGVAKRRVRDKRWHNVELVHEDAAAFYPPEPVDIVTFSYSLTMMPEWFSAIDHAQSLLAPQGQVGVVDFYVSRQFEPKTRVAHSWGRRTFWSVWFGMDGVRLNGDHIAYLQKRFDTQSLTESLKGVPYIPFYKVPTYRFVGTIGKTR
jgi:S-adenosylmethionine-diacylgycerolhomoserine-N-methlytransferase